MNRLNITTLFLVCMMVALVGCLDNTGSDPEPVVEPMGWTYYYVANQSQADLNVVYNIAGFPVDSTAAVPANTTTNIFQLARTPSSPTPSEAFGNLRFYNQPGDTTNPRLTIEPVIDEHWDDITAEGDTVKKYELGITEEDLK